MIEEKEKKKTGLMTDRDSKILWFINDFGFCGLAQIMKQFVIKESNAYKIMKRLMRRGLVNHERIFHRQPGVYYLTKDGASFTDLPAITHVPEYQHTHHFMVIELYIKFKSRCPNVHWMSERWLVKNYKKKDKKDIKHIADAMLTFPDGKQVAVEVELTLKDTKRLVKIFSFYAKQNEIEEVWYFCDPSILPTIKKITEKKSFINVYNLSEYLNGQ